MKITAQKNTNSTYIRVYQENWIDKIKKLFVKDRERECCYLCHTPFHPEQGLVIIGVDVKNSNTVEHYCVCGLCNLLVK